MRYLLMPLLIVFASADPARDEGPHTFRGKTVEGWLAVFRDKANTDAQRREAIVTLGYFGPEARAAAPDLIEAVRRGPNRDQAVDALVSIGAGADVTVPILIDRFVKRGCQHLTGAGTFIIDISVDRALARVGEPAVPALIKILDGPDANMRVCAAYVLGEIGPAARVAVPALIRAIERADPGQDRVTGALDAIRALGRIGPQARAAVPALNGWLEKRRSYEFDTVLALDRIGVPPVRNRLDALLRGGDPGIVQQLAYLGPKAREAVPALRAALTDKRLQVRISAAVALAHIDPSASEAVPVLIEGLMHGDDQDLDVSGVPDALARLGPRARQALPELIGHMHKGLDEADVVQALVQIDPEGKECVPALIEALQAEEPYVVNAAANGLALLGPRAKDAIPALEAAMTRAFNESFAHSHSPQATAARALRHVDPQGSSSIPALIRALKYRHIVAGEDVDYSAAEAAAEVLGSYGSRAKEAVPALIDAVRTRDKDEANAFVRQAAALALGRIRPEGTAAILALRDFLKEHERQPREQAEAVIALYHLAPDGKQLAERWLQKPVKSWDGRVSPFELEGRAIVLGAMGRTSFECDWLARHYLEGLDWNLAHSAPWRDGPYEYLESWLDTFGRLGIAGRLAIPRLKELSTYPNPFVRLWAAEALERVAPPGK